MNNTFKTPSGIELPFLLLKGKQYLQVAHRLVWFRSEHPNWTIQTEVKVTNEKESIVCARILDEQGRLLSTGHKHQGAKDFAAHLEKAESGAIGRALAFLGYGTAHAQELEEDPAMPLNQASDSPLDRRPQAAPSAQSFVPSYQVSLDDPGDYIVTFGKHKGVAVKHVPGLASYVAWLEKDSKKPGGKLPSESALEFIAKAHEFLGSQKTLPLSGDDDDLGQIPF